MTTSNPKKITRIRFSVSLVCVITLFVLMTSGSAATTVVYASHNSSSTSNTGSSSSTPSTSGSSSSGSSSGSGSGGSSTAHCDRPGYPSCSSLGSQAGASAFIHYPTYKGFLNNIGTSMISINFNFK